MVTGYHNIAERFFADKGFKHVALLSADGALEAAPAMGSADIILDLVGRGVRHVGWRPDMGRSGKTVARVSYLTRQLACTGHRGRTGTDGLDARGVGEPYASAC